jgi:hypothetical protein
MMSIRKAMAKMSTASVSNVKSNGNDIMMFTISNYYL